MSWWDRARHAVTRRRPDPPTPDAAPSPTESAAESGTPPTSDGVVPDRVLVFLHVPKTAGTSLREFIDDTLQPGLLAPQRNRLPETMPDDEIAALARYRAFAGHFDVVDLTKFPGPQSVFTVLRDPVDMLVSLYDFWRAHAPDFIEEHDLVGPRLARAKPFEDFVGDVDPRITHDLDNPMVRTFTGRIRSDDPLDDPESSLDEAIARLEGFRHVGHVAQLDRTFEWIAGELGVDAVVPERRNVRGRWTEAHMENVDRTEPTAAARDALRPLTELDRRLVAHFFPSLDGSNP